MTAQPPPVRNWVRMRTDSRLRGRMVLRARTLAGIRGFLDGKGFMEVDPPCLVPLPGMEPHLDPFSTALKDHAGRCRTFYLHTSPEYALKKLLCAGFERIYSLVHVFRNGEISDTHNPEFTMLEWYRVGADYRILMEDCEGLVVHLCRELGLPLRRRYAGHFLDLTPPWPRISLGEAMERFACLDLNKIRDQAALVDAARRKGYSEVDPSWAWEDVFYRIFLQEVEPRLPKDRPFFLVDYPVEMGALARVCPDDSRWVERFELYMGGLELANAFSELTDPGEQRRRLMAERMQRATMGKDAYPVDRTFLEALEQGLPPSAGIALGVDRLLMILADARRIREVLPFPTEDLLHEWERCWENG